MDIQTIRKKYPQYDDLSDAELAHALHDKYYPDMAFDAFAGKIGLKQGQPTASDRAASFGSGANEAIAETLGAPANLIAEGLNFIPGVDIGEPVGGSQWIRERLLPERVTPKDTLGQYLNAAGQGVGGALTGGLLMGGAAEAIPAARGILSLLPKSARGLLGEAALGATSGAGAKAGNEVGGPVGALVGGLALPASLSVGRIPLRVARAAAGPFFDSGVRTAVGKALAESAANKGHIPLQRAAVPGVNLTTGQATNDPGLMALERSVQMKTPENQGLFQARRSEQNQAIRGALEGQSTNEEPGIDMQSELQAGLQRAKYKAAKAYDRVNEIANAMGEANTITPAKTKASIQSLLKQYPDLFDRLPDQSLKRKLQSLAGALQDNITTKQPKILLPNGQPQRPIVSREPQTLSFDDARFLRRQLGNYLRRAYKSPGAVGSEETNALGRVRGALETDITDWAEHSGNNELVDALHNADAIYQGNVVPFKGAPLKDAVSTDEAGNPRTTASRLGPAFIKSGPGGKESLDAYIKATGGTPKAMQAARDHFGNVMLEKAQSRAIDAEGNRMIGAGALRSFADANRNTIKRLYTPAQQKVIQAIVDSSEMAARTARAGLPGGSDTAAKIGGQRFIDALAWRYLKVPFGAIDSALTGVGNVLYAGPNEKIAALLRDAMLDPKLAKALMMKASEKNAAMLPKRYRPAIFGVMGYGGANSAQASEKPER